MISELDLTHPKCPHQAINKDQKYSPYGSQHHHPDTPSDWQWMPADLIMVEQAAESSTWTRIKSNDPIAVSSPKSDLVQKAQVSLTVQMTPNLNYDAKRKEWSWHKSWIIPKLTVSLGLDSDSQGTLRDVIKQVKDLVIEVRCVRPSSRNSEELSFVDMGLEGSTSKKGEFFRDVTFQALKFKTTSYKNEGYMFNILVLVRQTVSEAYSKVVASRISPPVFIDSRKVVKNGLSNSLMDVEAFTLPSHLFSPEAFNKQLVKKSRSATSDISNNIQGLYEYLTAANIRNKIKNPFYLSYRFSNCISLFYNTCKVGDSKVAMELSKNIVSVYMEEQEECSHALVKKKKNKLAKRDISRYIDFNNDCIIALVIRGLSEQISLSKIIERYGHYYENILCLTSAQNQLSPNFAQLEDSQDIVRIYSNFYSRKISNRDVVKKFHYQTQVDSKRLCGYRLKNQVDEPNRKIEILHTHSKEVNCDRSLRQSTELTLDRDSKLLYMAPRVLNPLSDFITNDF